MDNIPELLPLKPSLTSFLKEKHGKMTDEEKSKWIMNKAFRDEWMLLTAKEYIAEYGQIEL
jgi:hypothetical protein